MEENKYICPKCGSEMIAVYEKPALNLTCQKCGCQIATTKWEEIDLDDNDYTIILKPVEKPSIKHIKAISAFTGLNFISSKTMLENGNALMTGKAIDIKEKSLQLDKLDIEYHISPDFPY